MSITIDSSFIDSETVRPARAGSGEPPRFGLILALWLVLTLGLQTGQWLAGWRSLALAEAVERGAAVVEARKFGEEPNATIRKAIRTQRDSLSFWSALTAIGDFGLEPLGIVVRAIAVATLFSTLAALTGRPAGFDASLSACALAQGVWVAALAFRLALTLATGRAEVETSLTLALPSGTYWAPLWVAARQFDLIALVGWTVLAIGGWRRGQAALPTAALVCGLLWASEATARAAWTLTVESGTRMMLIPEWIAR